MSMPKVTLDELKSDLEFQLSVPGALDWDKLLELTIKAKIQADIENRNSVLNGKPKSCRSILDEVISKYKDGKTHMA